MEGSSSLCLVPTSLASNDKRTKINDATDSINDLPEAILHHILSFLDMKQVVQTSLVSRRWRNLWVSIPILSFNHSLWNNVKTLKRQYIGDLGWEYELSFYRKNEFMDFVDEVLNRRDGSTICKFHLFGDSYCDEDRIGRWIICLAKNHPHEIDINIIPRLSPDHYYFLETYELPHCLFLSAIEVFKFKVDTHDLKFTFQLPDSMCSATHLKSLHLVSVMLPKGDLEGELILSCPVLENLIVVGCDCLHLKMLTISATQLKNLVLDNQMWGRTESCKIKIITPSLLSFQYKSVFKEFYVENLPSLYHANILSPIYREVKAKSFIKVFTGIRSATKLDLSGWFNYKASESPNLFDELPHTFYNLKSLKLRWCSGSCIGLVTNLLKRSPYIETLVLDIIKSEPEKDWAEELSIECIFDHLKSIEIKNINDYCENGLKFLEFLLKNAMLLENIRVAACEEPWCSEDFVENCKKLQALPRASSSATILFS